jgi:DNA-binding transcriptional ArsR family regulator
LTSTIGNPRVTDVVAQQVLDALGDPTRRRVFELLRDGPIAVGEIADQMPVSRPAVSKHLKVLSASGLVTHVRVGTRSLYRIDARGLTALRDYLDGFWTDVLDAFAEHVEASVAVTAEAPHATEPDPNPEEHL